jgi:hypothetical protein
MPHWAINTHRSRCSDRSCPSRPPNTAHCLMCYHLAMKGVRQAVDVNRRPTIPFVSTVRSSPLIGHGPPASLANAQPSPCSVTPEARAAVAQEWAVHSSMALDDRAWDADDCCEGMWPLRLIS